MQIVTDCKKQKKDLDDAMKQAVKSAIKQNILTDFLKANGSEVYNMLALEYDEELEKKVQREEALQEGIEKGIRGAIEMLRSIAMPEEIIFDQIQQKFNLTAEQAKIYMKKL